MMIRLWVLMASLLFSFKTMAFPCFATLVKDNCWTNYQVDVVIIDVTTRQELATVTAKSGESWARQKFECQPAQTLTYKATFTPTIWEGEEGKEYRALKYWFLPTVVDSTQSAWEIPICFAKTFAEVPFPVDATGTCVCNFKAVPKILPQ